MPNYLERVWFLFYSFQAKQTENRLHGSFNLVVQNGLLYYEQAVEIHKKHPQNYS